MISEMCVLEDWLETSIALLGNFMAAAGRMLAGNESDTEELIKENLVIYICNTVISCLHLF